MISSLLPSEGQCLEISVMSWCLMPLNMSFYQREDLPYNNYELNQARDQLIWERMSGQISRFQYRRFTDATSREPNVWEGERGFMEHIRQRFPMPPNRSNIKTDDSAPIVVSDSDTAESHSNESIKRTKKRKLNAPEASSSNAKLKKYHPKKKQ